MTSLLRADLDALPAYVPGRVIPGAVKLASNEITLPPPPRVLAAVAEAAANGNRYPDLGVTALTARLAAEHGVAPEQVSVACGSVTLCQQLVQIVCGTAGHEVLYAWRSFEAYPIVTQVGLATARTVALDGDYRHDLDAMAAAVTPATRLVLICSPNNPTGTAVTRAELERFLDAVGPHVLVAVDQAYQEFVDDPDAVDARELLAAHPNLVVLRTFSKAYRLAAFRVGYSLSHPDVAAALRKVCSAFSVNALAQAAAIASLEVKDELLVTCADVARERVRVRDALVGMGYTVPPSQANFLWLDLGERTAAFAAHCLDHKVVVRPFAPEGCRVTVSVPEENDLFLAAAASFAG